MKRAEPGTTVRRKPSPVVEPPTEDLMFAEIDGIEGRPTPALQRRAKLFRVKRYPLEATRSAPSLYNDDDMIELLFDQYNLRKPIRVWAARSVDEVLQTNQEIKRSRREVGFTFFDCRERAEQYPLVLYASRTDGAVEGVLAADRSVILYEDGVSYYLSIELIYVTAKARRKSVATALKMCFANIVRGDLNHLVAVGRSSRRKVPINVTVYGEIESVGGERAINEIYSLIESHVEMMFDDYPIECDSEWGW